MKLKNFLSLSFAKSIYSLAFVILTISIFYFSDMGRVFAQSEGVVDTVSGVGNNPIGVAYNEGNGNMYVTNLNSDTVSVIDENNDVVDTVSVGQNPSGVAYNPGNGNMYVANTDSDTVSVIDENNDVVDTVSVGIDPIGVAYNEGNGNMYVANTDSDTVSVIDENNDVVDTITVGNGPTAVAYNAGNGYIYVANFNSATVSVIDENNDVVDTVSVGNTPRGVAYNEGNGNMYVANQGLDTVSVIDQNNDVVDTVSVGNAPRGVAYNEGNGNMYVTNGLSVTVSVIDQNNDVVDTVSVGQNPFGVAYNPRNGNMYVTNVNSNTVSVIGSIVPIANAGSNQTVDSGDTVQLDGSGSSDPRNETLTYQWTQTSGPLVTLSDPTAVNPTFTAPLLASVQDLVFQLVVTNEQDIESEPDSVTITVSPVNAPTANAGADQTIDSGDTVQLDGSASSTNPSGGILTYQWTQTSGPMVTLSDSTAVNPTFTAPLLASVQDLVFQLVVTNEQDIESEPDSVTITVSPVNAPTANAGADQTIDSGDTVQLDGSASSTNPSGGILTYQWTQTSGPMVTLSDPTAVNPTFNAPDVLLQRDLVFELVVTNEAGIESEPDSVTIKVVSNIEGIVGSGNNINIQVQENTGNNVGGQSGFGEGLYSDSPILQGQSTEQDSQVIS